MAAAKRKSSPNGTDFAMITVDGEQVRPREAMFVVWDSEGVPLDAFPSDTTTRDDLARAARSYWSGSTEAILALNAGQRITLTTMRRFLVEVAAHMVSGGAK